jgi:hypothetical protein
MQESTQHRPPGRPRGLGRQRAPALHVGNFPPDLHQQLAAAAKAAERSMAAEAIVRLRRSLQQVADEAVA